MKYFLCFLIQPFEALAQWWSHSASLGFQWTPKQIHSKLWGLALRRHSAVCQGTPLPAHGLSEAKPAFLMVVASSCPSPGWVLWHEGARVTSAVEKHLDVQRIYKDKGDRTEWWQGDKWDWAWPDGWKVLAMNCEEERLRLEAINSWCHLRVEDSSEITWSGTGELAGCGTKLRWMRRRGKKWDLIWSGKREKTKNYFKEKWGSITKTLSRLKDCLLSIF